MAKPKSQLIERKRLLDDFDIVSEEDIATIFDIDLKTLRNRPASKKPKMKKVGAKNVTTRQWLRAYLEGVS